MREWIPIPGSTKAKIIHVALEHFEVHGFERASVVEIARAAGATTGALYHHFGSKAGLFVVLRDEMERRLRDRMKGAAAAAGPGRSGVRAAVLVAFDAAVEFETARLLSEPAPEGAAEVLNETLRGLLQDAPPATEQLLLGAWRSGLAALAAGAAASEVRDALAWLLDGPSGGA